MEYFSLRQTNKLIILYINDPKHLCIICWNTLRKKGNFNWFGISDSVNKRKLGFTRCRDTRSRIYISSLPSLHTPLNLCHFSLSFTLWYIHTVKYKHVKPTNLHKLIHTLLQKKKKKSSVNIKKKWVIVSIRHGTKPVLE